MIITRYDTKINLNSVRYCIKQVLPEKDFNNESLNEILQQLTFFPGKYSWNMIDSSFKDGLILKYYIVGKITVEDKSYCIMTYWSMYSKFDELRYLSLELI